MLCYVKRYKSNEFIEIYSLTRKSKNYDMKIKKPKKPKNLKTFLKNLRFLPALPWGNFLWKNSCSNEKRQIPRWPRITVYIQIPRHGSKFRGLPGKLWALFRSFEITMFDSPNLDDQPIKFGFNQRLWINWFPRP